MDWRKRKRIEKQRGSRCSEERIEIREKVNGDLGLPNFVNGSLCKGFGSLVRDET